MKLQPPDDDMRVDSSDVTTSTRNDHKRQCICQIRHQKMRVVQSTQYLKVVLITKFCLYAQIITKNENQVDPSLVK